MITPSSAMIRSMTHGMLLEKCQRQERIFLWAQLLMPLRFVDDVYVYFQDEIKYFRVFLKTSVLYSPRRTGPLPWCRSYPRPLTLLLCIRINTTNTDSPTVRGYFSGTGENCQTITGSGQAWCRYLI